MQVYPTEPMGDTGLGDLSYVQRIYDLVTHGEIQQKKSISLISLMKM